MAFIPTPMVSSLVLKDDSTTDLNHNHSCLSIYSGHPTHLDICKISQIDEKKITGTTFVPVCHLIKVFGGGGEQIHLMLYCQCEMDKWIQHHGSIKKKYIKCCAESSFCLVWHTCFSLSLVPLNFKKHPRTVNSGIVVSL